MSRHRLAPQAEAELNDIWQYVAVEGGGVEIAVVCLTRLWSILCSSPRTRISAGRDTDLRPGLRSFPIANYVIFYRVESDGSVLILRVLHGSRDLPALKL